MRPRTRDLVLGVLAAVVLTCAAASPLILAAAGHWWETDWVQLANIGQAYGAASALFSALAFIGIAAGLLYQARQLRLQRIQVTREKHERLMALASEDPETYGVMFGPIVAAMTPLDMRRRFFCLMLLNYLRMSYENGTYSEDSLRLEALPKHFANAAARQHWAASRRHWLHDDTSRTYRRFARIVDEEFHTAVAMGPPSAEMIVGVASADGRRNQERGWAGPASAAAAGVVIGWLVARRR
ncbi:hypothetical protein BJY16_004802 [Actinoplanes octamycinicus]|uniref:Uncharacterized protein n=1 Tax=Actinoplanes octamycinicus TaxID=135948 RepID=A0A7W7GZW1_9ACTN|nr:DUF6082 family protein [Actinoplanes octamycinicus]MBB4741343.1 hypothetical protein [Actinoplanes octamycinicus]